MGAPVETGIENFEEAILKLSFTDRAKLISWISDSLVEEVENVVPEPEAGALDEELPEEWPPTNVKFEDNPSGQPSWHDGIRQAKDLTEEERLKVLYEMSGAWKDTTPDDLAKQIISSRTVSTREFTFDD
jgi:hypothetical protein